VKLANAPDVTLAELFSTTATPPVPPGIKEATRSLAKECLHRLQRTELLNAEAECCSKPGHRHPQGIRR
jgi:hypothetical protein